MAKQKLNTDEEFEVLPGDTVETALGARLYDGREFNFYGFQYRYDVRFHSYNYLNDGSWSVRGSVRVDYFCDDFQIYSFQAASLEIAMVEAVTKLWQLRHLHPNVILASRSAVEKTVLTRPVYWHGNAAVVEFFDGIGGVVELRAATEDKRFDVPDYVARYEAEDWDRHRVKVDLLSPHIHWHREVSDGE